MAKQIMQHPRQKNYPKPIDAYDDLQPVSGMQWTKLQAFTSKRDAEASRLRRGGGFAGSNMRVLLMPEHSRPWVLWGLFNSQDGR
jgi:hypothetical protein